MDRRAQEQQSRILDAMAVAGTMVVAVVVVVVVDSQQEPENEIVRRHSED